MPKTQAEMTVLCDSEESLGAVVRGVFEIPQFRTEKRITSIHFQSDSLEVDSDYGADAELRSLVLVLAVVKCSLLYSTLLSIHL